MVAPRFADQLKALPNKPGVYLMRNAGGDVIYVGKAANLKNRVRSYFGAPASLEPKTRRLVHDITDFEFIVTSSEQEAHILESTLVKQYQPHFNIRLKDDKHYPYLKVDLTDPWPRVYITRRVEDDGARYFGPYASSGSVRTTLDLVKKLFPWRSCTKTITGNDSRPCLDYYIKRCIAPCTSYCTKEEYDEVIKQVLLFLEGRTDEVIDDLTAKMNDAAERFDYERAAMHRDQIDAVRRITERQQMATTKPVDMDVFGIARADDEACVQVFFVRGTKVVGRDHFVLQGVQEESDEQVLSSFLEQFYGSAVYIPRDILLPVRPTDASLIMLWLSGRRGRQVHLTAPRQGERRKLVELAGENARQALDMLRVKWLADSGKTRAALEELQEELGLPTLPRRIECYDNSNIQGASAVAGMVVFVDGHPRPSEYRRFKIKTVEGANDVASMAEVLRRRFKRARDHAERASSPDGDDKDRSWSDLPDLVIVDGGRPQLAAALDAMRDSGAGQIPAVGLAKEHEEIFMKDVSEPVLLPRTSPALYLVQRLRDEAHRFAITFHRQVRGKSAVQSRLDDIPGIGPTRKKALLRKFGSVRAIREAELADIAATGRHDAEAGRGREAYSCGRQVLVERPARAPV
ncbi:MAG: excinuclease ABC subunit UvrC [Dehalococcoidia bacterium]